MRSITTNDNPARRRAPRADIAFAFALAIALYLAWMVRDVLLIVYVSGLFAVVLLPVVNYLRRIRIRGWQPNRLMAILLLLLIVAGLASLFFAFAVPPVVRDLSQLLSELPRRGPQFLRKIQNLPIVSHLDLGALNAKFQDLASNIAGYLVGWIRIGAGKFFDLLTGIILTIYFMLEGEIAYAWFLSFFPDSQRERLDRTLTRAEFRMGKWLLGQGSLMLILGVSSTIVFVALKIRYAYALGVLMGLFNLIPIVGAMISVSLALMVASIDSLGSVLGEVIFNAIYVQIENSVLTPRIMKSSVGLSGLSVLIALLLGASFAGVVGALVAVPTAVLVGELLTEYLTKPRVVASDPAEMEAASAP